MKVGKRVRFSGELDIGSGGYSFLGRCLSFPPCLSFPLLFSFGLVGFKGENYRLTNADLFRRDGPSGEEIAAGSV